MFSFRNCKVFLAFPIILICCFLPFSDCEAVTGMVVIEAGGEETFSLKIAENLTKIMNQLETSDLSPVEHLFTDEGYQIITDVLNLFPMINATEVQKSRLISYPGGGWEVRDLRVFVKSGDADAAGMPWQYLVFSLDADARVTDARFSLKMRNYKDVLEGGKRMKAGTVYDRLFSFIDSLESAYNSRDAKKIINAFDDNPLIIVGRVDYSTTNTVSFSGLEVVSKNKIEFIRKTRAEYLASLEMVYRQNISAHMSFDSIKIVHRDTTEQIYGITLHQKMRSASYSDKGWIFLMVSMKNPKTPRIHMRSWQEVAFNDGPDLYLSPPKHGSVSVSALPVDVEIKVDDKIIGLSSGKPIEVTRLNVGNHELEVNLDGYHGYSKTFQVFYHRTTYLEVSLDPIANTLYITTYPDGAKIYFNGKKIENLSPVKLDSVEVGSYSLKAKLAGYHQAYYGGYLEPSSFVDIEIDMVPIRRMEAVIRSMVLPGEGQRFLGHPIKGWTFTVLQAAAIAYGVYTFTDYLNKRSDYRYSLDKYWESVRIDETFRIDYWLKKYKDDQVIMNDAAARYNQAWVGIGLVYSINLADVGLFSRGSIVDSSEY